MLDRLLNETNQFAHSIGYWRSGTFLWEPRITHFCRTYAQKYYQIFIGETNYRSELSEKWRMTGNI